PLAAVVARAADLTPPPPLASQGRGAPAEPTDSAAPSRTGRGADRRSQLPAPPFPDREGGPGGLGSPILPIRAEHYFEPPAFTYANAVQAALVEVDVETGQVALLKLV